MERTSMHRNQIDCTCTVEISRSSRKSHIVLLSWYCRSCAKRAPRSLFLARWYVWLPVVISNLSEWLKVSCDVCCRSWKVWLDGYLNRCWHRSVLLDDNEWWSTMTSAAQFSTNRWCQSYQRWIKNTCDSVFFLLFLHSLSSCSIDYSLQIRI